MKMMKEKDVSKQEYTQQEQQQSKKKKPRVEVNKEKDR
jgi:hypothetical protein